MAVSNKVILREKSSADAWDDYAWETDPELAELDAAPVVSIPYSQYLLEYTHQLDYSPKTSRRFAVDTLDGKHIGNCSYYNLDKPRGEVEVGIMIGNQDYWSQGYGTDAITTLINHIFEETQVNRVRLKTLLSNIRAQKCFQKCGFIEYKQLHTNGYNFMFMEIFRKQWQERQTESQ
ncbi:GNAT family N-acetyltransferase [Chloroflexota bacterium]